MGWGDDRVRGRGGGGVGGGGEVGGEGRESSTPATINQRRLLKVAIRRNLREVIFYLAMVATTAYHYDLSAICARTRRSALLLARVTALPDSWE